MFLQKGAVLLAVEAIVEDEVCYGTGLGELTKTCMLIECGQGVL
jgi:hypothetical protein